MSALPSDASSMPVPEPVPAVVTVTPGFCWWYAAAQARARG